MRHVAATSLSGVSPLPLPLCVRAEVDEEGEDDDEPLEPIYAVA